MLSDAYIRVTCDDCGTEEEIQLTATAHGYDERGVNDELEDMGWLVVDDKKHYCEECKEQHENENEDEE